MFYHLKIILRNLHRNGIYSIINIAGLAVSLTTFILIMLWVWDELNFDKIGKRPDDIFRLAMTVKNNENYQYWTQTSIPMLQTAKEHIPEVEEACVIDTKYNMSYIAYNEKVFSDDAFCMVDTSFFRVFNVSFIEGASGNALAPGSIVLTHSLAKKIFGGEQALGKHLTGMDANSNEPGNYFVSAVIADFPEKSFLHFDAFIPFKDTEYQKYIQTNMWSFQNFLMLHPNADSKTVAHQLTNIFDKGQDKISFQLQSFNDIHLYDPSGKETGMASVRLFSWIAWLILLIACVNYINLVTARASKRNREIGVKKMLGAKKYNVFGDLMRESITLFLIALSCAYLLMTVLLPFCNRITGKTLSFIRYGLPLGVILISAFASVIILAGIYPALQTTLSGMRKAVIHTPQKYSLRRILVVFQFIITSGLIVSTIVLNRQLHFVLNKQLGFDKEQVCSINIGANGLMQQHYDSFKADLEQLPFIAGVTATSTNILDANQYAYTSGFQWEGMDKDKPVRILDMNIDDSFFGTMKIPVIAGSDFTHTPADVNRFYLNETAVKQMGITNPIDLNVSLFGNKGQIAGVVRDFHFRNLNNRIDPIIMTTGNLYPRMIYIRFHKGNIVESLASTEKVWKKYNGEIPFSFEFLDDTLQQMYMPEQQKSMLFGYFSFIAILISCLGLFGLVTYTAESKTKEIGIRKVLGGSVGSIVTMLSKEFLILVGIALLIAFPLTYYWLDKMLQDYAYRIAIGWQMFALAGIITIALTLLTVGWKAIKAATANPVKAIKTE